MTEAVAAPAALRRFIPFAVAALVCIIGGGLLAAASAYATTEKSAWATAYLVLVGGVAQGVLGGALAWFGRARLTWWVLACWNLGNAGVLLGQLSGMVIVTDLGGAVLVVALLLALAATRTQAAAGSPPPLLLWSFRGVVVLLAVSIPVGLLLANLPRR